MDQPPTRWYLIARLLAFHAEGFAAGEAGENADAERHLRRLVMDHALHTGGLAGLLGTARACAYPADPASPGGGTVTVDADLAEGKRKQQPVEPDTGLEVR